ncbi:uncharacterized protein C20orf204 homolog [Zonotrichia leucophrys gambelii]|uniref:uncharacterized protein C20orf204 homolog n=1 Tax=Zonotrichia leucophrys gambelii TaxID=257770 RepID=UPI00314087D1
MRTLLVLIFWGSHPGQSLGAIVSVHSERRVKESPHANRNRNCGGLQPSVQLRAGDTRGLEPPGGCEQGLLPRRPLRPLGPCGTPGTAAAPAAGGAGRAPGAGPAPVPCPVPPAAAGPVPSPPTVEPSSNRGPRRSGTGPDRAPRDPRGSMIFPRVLSCAVLLLLLVAVLSRGRRCSIARILRQYRAVIFHELQNLRNLTGSVYRSGRAGPACRSDKDQRILLSIYNISMSLREAGDTLQGPEELVVWRVARNTNTVLRENCRRISKSPAHPGPAPRRQPARRRQQRLRDLGRKAERLQTCWEKLNALHAPRQTSWDS